MNIENGWRYQLVGAMFAVMALLIVGQSIYLQFGPLAEIFRKQGEIYSGETVTLLPPRGQIFDRWGHLLAGNVTVYEVGVDINTMQDADAIAFALNGVLGLDYVDTYTKLTAKYEQEAPYVVLTDFVPVEKANILIDYLERQYDAIEKGIVFDSPSLIGLILNPHLMRTYPEEDLASNVLGFVRRDGGGYFGVEQFYNDLLTGTPVEVFLPNDPNQVNPLPEVPPGASLVLTIDREIQDMVEEQLDQAVQLYGATAGTVVVMDPQTGEILAMASTPRLDLNEYWRYPEIYPDKTPFNRAVSASYEPGSVFKVLTLAAALDSGAIKPNTNFFDPGVFNIGGISIFNWDGGAWGQQDITGCMRHSLNVCLAWMGSEMGADLFYTYMERFGFGHTTGIDLALEANGRLKIPGDGDWYPADLGTNTFGQGIAVTPVQMLMAISALANDGQMVVPHLVRALIDKGQQYDFNYAQVSGSPISAEAAHQASAILAASVVDEADVDSFVPGYTIAGKTGTAEIPTELGYTRAITNASFVGWGPIDDAQFLVYVWLEEPTTSIWGSQTAAPLFVDIVERLVVLMDIPPDKVRAGTAP